MEWKVTLVIDLNEDGPGGVLEYIRTRVKGARRMLADPYNDESKGREDMVQWVKELSKEIEERPTRQEVDCAIRKSLRAEMRSAGRGRLCRRCNRRMRQYPPDRGKVWAVIGHYR